MFDANSGTPILTSYNIPTATNTPGVSGPVYRYDEHGSLIAYFINGAKHWLCEWNSTLMLQNYPGIGTSSIYTPPVGAVINWTTGIQFNVTIPVNYAGEIPAFGLGLPMSTQKIIFAHTGSISLDTLNDTVEAYDANTGAQLWYRVFNGSGSPPDPYIPGTTAYQFFGPTVENVMCIFQEATHQWFGYDATTGAYIWGPTTFADLAWNEFQSGTAANGML